MFKGTLVTCTQKFFEGYREHIDNLQLSHGYRHSALLHRNAQQRSCSDDMVLGSLVAKVFEAIKRFFALLYLIEYHQRFASQNGLVAIEGQFLDKSLRVFRNLKYRLQFRLAVEIKLNTIFETFFAKCFHHPSLSCLAGTFKQDWLSVRSLFPCFKLIDNISFYPHILRRKVRFCVYSLHFF